METPEPAPETRFFDGQELPLSLADFRGKVVLLNVWATWCPPCVFEMPTLDAVQGRLGPEGLAVVAVSVDREGLDIVGPFLRDLAVRHLEIYLDPLSRLARALGVTALPTTYLIDAQGRLAGYLRAAADWNSPDAEALLRYYLGKTSSGGELLRTGG